MEQIALKASLREGKGKQKSIKVRHEGLVPGIVYHRGEGSVSISLVEKDLLKILRAAAGENVLISLTVNPSDMGKLIGRQGNTAKALRTLLRVIGMKNNARVNLKINEPEGSTRPAPSQGSSMKTVDQAMEDLKGI